MWFRSPCASFKAQSSLWTHLENMIFKLCKNLTSNRSALYSLSNLQTKLLPCAPLSYFSLESSVFSKPANNKDTVGVNCFPCNIKDLNLKWAILTISCVLQLLPVLLWTYLVNKPLQFYYASLYKYCFMIKVHSMNWCSTTFYSTTIGFTNKQ